MKLNLHPKEFLCLYNLLEDQRRAGFEEPPLQEVHNRMKSYIVTALSRCSEVDIDNVFMGWEKNQKKKIDDLNEQLKTVPGKDFLSQGRQD